MAMPSSIASTPTGSDDLVSLMQAVDPSRSATVKRLAFAPNEEFFLRHHPAQWEPESDGLAEATWLPDISRLTLTPGAHLVRTRKRHEDPSETYKHAMNVDGNKGWVHLDPNAVIPADCLPAGIPAGGYLRAIPCKDPRSSAEGVRYVEAWDVPRAPVPGRPQKSTHNRAAYNRWRLWLVTSGQIKPPTDDVLAEMQATKAGRPARIGSVPRPEDLRKTLVAQAQAEVDMMASAVIPEADEVAPVPTRKPAARKPREGVS